MTAPLDGIVVVDFSQFLAGPYASLRLLDMGARVIKVENPNGGDLCRQHYTSQTKVNGDSTIFHAINRGKESIALDLKNREDLERAKKLIAHADVVIQNFRPGVMQRLGLDYSAARAIKANIIYGSISGYGPAQDAQHLPGQDLLAQARSGVMWLSGNQQDGPVPVGLPIADISAGANLAQGLLGALFRRAMKGVGAHVETSLLEALIDLQFEFLTTYLNNGQKPPERLEAGSAHGYLAAPYGVYETESGHLVIAMSDLHRLANALDLPALRAHAGAPENAHTHRNEIHQTIQKRLRDDNAINWESALTEDGIWCAKVLDWSELLESYAFLDLDMISQAVEARGPRIFSILRPFRLDGKRGKANKLGPPLNDDYCRLMKEFNL